MPFVSGFLRLRKRGHPDQGLPPGEGPTDPDYGVDEGAGVWPDPGHPDIGLPAPPPGIWPPLTPDHPWLPLFPSQLPTPGGPPPTAEHPIALPPGTVWPPLPPDVHGKYLALVLIGGGGHGAHYRYVVIDADAKPPARPDQGLPPTAQPKRT
jgi:hypothetical protein